MGNPFGKYIESDVINNAIDSGELHFKPETNGIVVVYHYSKHHKCLLIIWYSDVQGNFVLDKFGPGNITKHGKEFIMDSLVST